MTVGYINTNQYNNNQSQMAYATQMVASDNGSIFTAAKEVCSDVVGSVMNPMSLIMAPLQMQDPIMSGYIRNYSLQAGYTWEKPVLFNGKTLFEKNKENPWTGYKSVKTEAGKAVESYEKALKEAKKGSDKKDIGKAQKALDEARKANGLQSVKQQFKNFNLGETLARGTSFQRDAYRSFAKSFSNLAPEEIVKNIAGKYDLKLANNADIQSVLEAIQTENNITTGQIMASLVITSLPIFVVYIVAQKYIVQGFGSAGLKL